MVRSAGIPFQPEQKLAEGAGRSGEYISTPSRVTNIQYHILFSLNFFRLGKLLILSNS
jgi:hypothetical protein